MGTLSHTMAGHLATAGVARPRVLGCPSMPGHHAGTGTTLVPDHGNAVVANEQGSAVKPGAIWAYDPATRFARRRSELSP